MKLLAYVSFVLLAVFGLQSCSEDFKIGAPYKNVMVVYGLIAKSDSAHYVKITRGYFDEAGNNITSAKNIDSLYHSDLTVSIEELNSAGTLVKTIPCQKVNLKDEGIIKDTGVFVSDPAYAYKFKDTLVKSNKYRLVVVDNTNGKRVQSTTSIISQDASDFKTPLMTLGFNGYITPFDFSKEAKNQEIRWSPPANSAIVDIFMKFDYVEENTVTGITKDRTVFVPLVRNSITPVGETKNAFISRSGFIGLLTEALGAGGSVDVIKRYVDTPAVYYTAGGVRLKEFIDATRAQGGITADEIRPVYRGGLEGDDVYGLWDTRVTRIIRSVPFTKETVDSMIFSPAFRNLNIVGVSPK
ncbi:MAG: hypothetical protein RL660_2594 [Bacteroidota bacterium]|jgi:hypothetical protein